MQALAAVPAHTLKQTAPIRDLTTVCHVVPGPLSQGNSHGARLGYRGDDAPYCQRCIVQGGQISSRSLFDALVIAHLYIFHGWNPLRHLDSAPPHPAIVGIRLHATPGVPAVSDPDLRLRLHARMHERVYRSQAMALHWSIGRRARMASSRSARVALAIAQLRSRALIMPSTAATRTSSCTM
jgi:hypothetical protein